MSETFGKGIRVRIVEGDHADVEGVIFWWGRSKWGHGMRAGVTPDTDEKEKLWVDAAELRAIDEDGKELDPQPIYAVVPERVEVEIRGIEVSYALARTMTEVRLARGYPKGKAPAAGVRLARLTAVEEQLGCRIPDAIIGYVVGALGSIREVGGVLALTEELLAHRDDDATRDLIVFERDNGNYLAFRRGAPSTSTEYVFLDHEESYEPAVTAELELRLLDELGDREIDRTTQPFEVVVDYITEDEPEPEAPAEQWVTHKKFGRGVVHASESTSKGNKLTVQFVDGDMRKLLDSFVEYD